MDVAGMQALGLIDYSEFPQALAGKYQHFTQADIGALRSVGYDRPFLSVEEGVAEYCDWLLRGKGR